MRVSWSSTSSHICKINFALQPRGSHICPPAARSHICKINFALQPRAVIYARSILPSRRAVIYARSTLPSRRAVIYARSTSYVSVIIHICDHGNQASGISYNALS